MRLYQNLPKASDKVVLKKLADIQAEGDHKRLRPESIEMVAQEIIEAALPFQVVDVEYNDPFDDPYAIIEYEWYRLDGTTEMVELTVPLTDIATVNGEPVEFIEVPKNYDPVLSDSFPPISLN